MNEERPRILVGDDEALIRARIKLILGGGFRIHEAATAAQVMEADPADYDAMMLDIMFPDGNGIDLCRHVKAMQPHLTVIISSSMETVDAWDNAFKAGADGYLEKRELMSLDRRKIVLMLMNLMERNGLRKQTEELSRRQSELLSVLSHDVRAPYQALLGTIDALRKLDVPSEAVGKIEFLRDLVRDQLAFINSLLELLRIESGASGKKLRPLDINLAVMQAVAGLRILADQKGITLTSRPAEGLDTILGDVGRLARLTQNLVSNAVKFTPKGGAVLVETRPCARRRNRGVELRVSDTGIGIGPEEKVKIFERFHRGRASGTAGEKGTGLGLAICREIVQLHGGALEAESNPGGGTVFTAWFPVAEA